MRFLWFLMSKFWPFLMIFDHFLTFLSIFVIFRSKFDQNLLADRVKNELISKIYAFLQIFKNSPFLSILGFLKCLFLCQKSHLNFKKRQKWPFLTFLARFCHFWPFLTFWRFWKMNVPFQSESHVFCHTPYLRSQACLNFSFAVFAKNEKFDKFSWIFDKILQNFQKFSIFQIFEIFVIFYNFKKFLQEA